MTTRGHSKTGEMATSCHVVFLPWLPSDQKMKIDLCLLMTAVKEKLNRDIVTCGPCRFQTIYNQAMRCHDQAVESRKM